MKVSAAVSAVALTVTGVTASVSKRADLPSISVKGNAFSDGSGRFYIRGVDYQPGGSSKAVDPIANADTCKRDIKYFKALGINTIRVYTVDNTASHDECMNALADAGIYLVLDVNTPKYSINRAEPDPSYNDVYLRNVFATVDAFAKYKNTLAFFSGNEVINDAKSTHTAPYVKAVTRDIRQYIGSRGYRKIPVGYSAADVESNRLEMAHYMNCGTDDERSDFFAFNDYSWCDPSSFTISGWDKKVEQYSDYSIPLFLSEFGCNTNKRNFGEIAALYSSKMTGVFSGGLVYEYSQEASGYGLVDIQGGSVSERDDYKALKAAYEKTPNPSGSGGAHTGGASQCPPRSSTWDVSTDTLPAIPEPAKKYMKDGAGGGFGLSGPGSQNAGTGSAGTAAAGSGAVQTGKHGSPAAIVTAPQVPVTAVVTVLAVVASTFLGAVLL